MAMTSASGARSVTMGVGRGGGGLNLVHGPFVPLSTVSLDSKSSPDTRLELRNGAVKKIFEAAVILLTE